MFDRFQQWLSKKLPAKLVYYCAVAVLSHSTSGKYRKTNVTGITAMEALGRWHSDKL